MRKEREKEMKGCKNILFLVYWRRIDDDDDELENEREKDKCVVNQILLFSCTREWMITPVVFLLLCTERERERERERVEVEL